MFFLHKKHLSAEDVMILTVISSFISSFIFWITTGIIKRIGIWMGKLLKKTYDWFKKLYRRYIEQKLNINELIAVEKKMKNGGKLKWYEKKSYYEFKEQQKKAKEEWAKQSVKLNNGIKKMNETIKNMRNMDKFFK